MPLEVVGRNVIECRIKTQAVHIRETSDTFSGDLDMRGCPKQMPSSFVTSITVEKSLNVSWRSHNDATAMMQMWRPRWDMTCMTCMTCNLGVIISALTPFRIRSKLRLSFVEYTQPTFAFSIAFKPIRFSFEECHFLVAQNAPRLQTLSVNLLNMCKMTKHYKEIDW